MIKKNHNTTLGKLVFGAVIGTMALGMISSAQAIPVSPSKYGFWSQRIELRVTNLAPLQNGQHYEGWAVQNNVPISTGKFNISADGKFVNIDGSIRKQRVFAADKPIFRSSSYFITREAAGDNDSEPSADVMLTGRIKATGRADLKGDGPARGKAELFVI